METVEAICVVAGTVALAAYAYMEYHDSHPAGPRARLCQQHGNV